MMEKKRLPFQLHLLRFHAVETFALVATRLKYEDGSSGESPLPVPDPDANVPISSPEPQEDDVSTSPGTESQRISASQPKLRKRAQSTANVHKSTAKMEDEASLKRTEIDPESSEGKIKKELPKCEPPALPLPEDRALASTPSKDAPAPEDPRHNCLGSPLFITLDTISDEDEVEEAEEEPRTPKRVKTEAKGTQRKNSPAPCRPPQGSHESPLLHCCHANKTCRYDDSSS